MKVKTWKHEEHVRTRALWSTATQDSRPATMRAFAACNSSGVMPGAKATRVARDSSRAAATALAARPEFVFGKLFDGAYDRFEYEDKD